jgi:hypothetical protein
VAQGGGPEYSQKIKESNKDPIITGVNCAVRE